MCVFQNLSIRSPLFWRAVMGEFLATTLFLYITITVRPPPIDTNRLTTTLIKKIRELVVAQAYKRGVLRRGCTFDSSAHLSPFSLCVDAVCDVQPERAAAGGRDQHLAVLRPHHHHPRLLLRRYAHPLFFIRSHRTDSPPPQKPVVGGTPFSF